MREFAEEVTPVRKKEILAFAGNVASYLDAKRKREILGFEVARNNREAEYIRDKIAVVRKRLDEKTDAAGKIERSMSGWEDKLISLRSERQGAEDEYAGLRHIEEDIEKRHAALEEKRQLAKNLREAVRNASEKLKTLRSGEQEALARRNHVGKKVKLQKERLNGLEKEVGVMRVTRDMLKGIIPEAIKDADIPEFEADTVQVIIEKYIAEVNETIDGIGNDISELEKKIDEAPAEEKRLSTEKEGLEGRLDELASRISTDEDKESLMAEVSGLEEDHGRLVRDIETNGEELKRIESEMTEVGDGIEVEREFQKNSGERFTYLKAMKAEMDGIDDIEKEIGRLGNEVQRINAEAIADGNFLNIANKVKEQVKSINSSLRSAVDECSETFSGIEQAANNLVG